MKKWALAGVSIIALVFPAAALANHVSTSSLSCQQLDFTYADYPSSGASETLVWKANGKVIATQVKDVNGSSGTFSSTPPDLSPYQGQTITVTGVRTGASDGTFTATITTAYCSSDQGPPGPQGPAGPTGGTGLTGASGKNGTNGQNGTTTVKVSKPKKRKSPKPQPAPKKHPKHKKHHKAPPKVKICHSGGETFVCGANPTPAGKG